MNINFTGINNPGFYYSQLYKVVGQNENGEYLYDPNESVNVCYLNTELTDDFNGKDLSNFRKSLKASKLEDAIHPMNSNSLNVGLLKGELSNDNGLYLFINGNLINIEDEKLPVISYVTKLLKQIGNSSKEITTDPLHFLSDEAANSLVLGQDVRVDFSKEEVLESMYNMYSEDNVRSGSDEMFNLLNKRMLEYFDIDTGKIQNFDRKA
ncbi:hypothetical protein HDR58_05175 [bacterium]|nr:hypothetical protein [bacterium]